MMNQSQMPTRSLPDFEPVRALLRKGQTEEAKQCSERILDSWPEEYAALINHATVLLAGGNAQGAIQFSLKAFNVDNKNFRPYVVIARAFIMAEDYLEANRYAAKAHEIWPDAWEPLCLIGISLARLKIYLDAELWLKKALERNDLPISQVSEVEFHLGQVLGAISGREVEALDFAIRATKNDPNNAHYIMGLGNILTSQGKDEEAQSAFDKALKICPLMGAIYWNKSRSKSFKQSDSEFIARMQDLYVKAQMSDTDRVLLGFSLAKAYRDLGLNEQAIDLWNTANAVNRARHNFHISIEEMRFASYYGMLPFNRDCRVEIGNSNESKPIFILGMPRSGTTLVEQIIGSHSSVTPLGELEYLARIVLKVYKSLGTLKSQKAMGLIRSEYLSEIKRHSVSTPYFTDKMPLNFRFIPVIINAFPEAKIIHCNRDPMAVCFSNFSNFFAAEGMAFTSGQQETATYFNLYSDFMDLVTRTFQSEIYQLDYQRLTEDQDIQTRELLAECGLDFERLCLNFQENMRSISTASQRQIRKGMYTGSTETWRRFEPWLGQMMATLKL